MGAHGNSGEAASPSAPAIGTSLSVSPALKAAAAGGVLEIDLGALAANYAILRRACPAPEMAGVVKADGYGLGAAAVGRTLAAAGCRTFFVALPEEGVILRRSLPEVKIYILSGPLPGSEPLFTAHDLRPVLNSPQQVAAWTAHAPRRPYALHVDTGMNRLGLSDAEFAALADRLAPSLVISHLACGDEPDHPLNAEQARRFAAVRARLPEAKAALANSAGCFLGADFAFDLGRPGIALYGGNPIAGRPNPMRPVVRLGLKILQVRHVDAVGTVGYGASRAVAPGMRLATVAGGYADGLPRTLGNPAAGTGVAWGRLAGVSVPMAGRVSMDLISFDVTAVPEADVRPGGLIYLMDDVHTVDHLADEAGTIPYELLTSLGRRYQRVYTGSGVGGGAC